jgi:hypothetical protein
MRNFPVLNWQFLEELFGVDEVLVENQGTRLLSEPTIVSVAYEAPPLKDGFLMLAGSDLDLLMNHAEAERTATDVAVASVVGTRLPEAPFLRPIFLGPASAGHFVSPSRRRTGKFEPYDPYPAFMPGEALQLAS